MKKRIFSILFALVLVVSVSLIVALPAAADPGTLYVDASTTADGTVSSYTHSSQTLVATDSAFASYNTGDAVEFLSDTADGWVTTIATKNSDTEVVLADSWGSDFNDGTFNLVNLAAPSAGDPFFYIQSAIDIASSGDDVDVAAGTYDENITLADGVSVYGAGAGASVIDGGDNGSVVTAENIKTTATTFDGFTIQNGDAYNGGGMHSDDCNTLTVSNCTFSSNTASAEGGGMYTHYCYPMTVIDCTFDSNTVTSTYLTTYGGGLTSYYSTLSLTGCTFTGNSSDDDGGGLYLLYGNSTVTDCDFISNTATNGGGMHNYGCDPTVTDCIFASNSATSYGGAMHNVNSTAPIVVNCIFDTNSAAYGGGLANETLSDPTLTNCTFYGNTASSTAHAVLCVDNSDAVLTNCIVWDGTGEIGVDGTSSCIVNYSDIYGSYSGTDNRSDDPKLEDPDNGDFHLQSDSPCIDTGSDTAPYLPDYDYEGEPREIDGDGIGDALPDMGADEYFVAPTEVWVDNDYCDTCGNDGHYWGYDAFDNIQDGINAITSPPGTVHVLDGIYDETITLVDGVSVYGNGAGSSIIDGSSSGRVVTANSIGSGTTFDGFTIQNGYVSGSNGGAGMRCDTSSLTVSNCTFSSNTADYYGGGMHNDTCSSMTVTNCIFTGNSGLYGGGMYNYACSSLEILECTFELNSASYYGGGLCTFFGTDPTTVTDCDFTNNTVQSSADDARGGGMATNGCDVTVSGCTFTSNHAIGDDSERGYGGGAFNYNTLATAFSTTFTDCDFISNTTNYYGGGMSNEYSPAVVTDCTFYDNSATDVGGSNAGGMYNASNSDVVVTDCTFELNSATSGGGMSNHGGSDAILDGCTFDTNTSSFDSGGINNNNSTVTMTDCVFSANNTTWYGGGMGSFVNSVVTLTNCIFSANTSTNYGGGIHNDLTTATLVNCTFSTNSALYGGAIANNSQADATLANCILWGDTDNEIYISSNSDATASYCDIQGGFIGYLNIDADPLFADAANGDLHLQAGSPCIDTGDDTAANLAGLATDYEGDNRYIDGNSDSYATVDMGADEYLPAEVWVDDGWSSAGTGDEVATGKFFGFNAFAVIQDGIDAVASPGTVHVLAGSYDENITLRDGVDVLGAGAGNDSNVNSIIDGDGTSRVVTASGIGADTTFDGFTVQNGGGDSTNGCGMRNTNGSALTVSNCLFYDNNGSSGDGGGMYNNGSSPTILNCVFAENYNATGGGMANNNSSPVVTNCTFYGNTVVQQGNGMYNYDSSPVVTNCIFWDTGTEIENAGTSSPLVSYCDIQGGYGGGTDIITDNPSFVDAPNGDYHLETGSPCIDAGTNSAASLPTYDFEGEPRVFDGNDDSTATADMGADEYVVPPTEVWVDDDWDDQDDVDLYNPTLIWQYDAFASIQDGIDALSGSTVHVLDGIYYELITLADGVDVMGAGDDVTFIDGSNSGRVVTASNITTATTFDGFTIQHGYITSGNGGAGMRCEDSSLTVSNCTFSSNTAEYYYGGGMYINNCSSMTVINCNFTGNTAEYFYGGGMYIENSPITVSGCTFTGNHASYGGGAYDLNCSSLTFTGCTFDSNTASSHGGGLCNWQSTVTVTSCDFTGNAVQNDTDGTYGGGMCNYSSDATVSGCTFTGNSATARPVDMEYGSGGGVYNRDTTLTTFTNCDFTSNTSDYLGGGMSNTLASPTLDTCTFNGNDAPYGGGICNNSASLTLDTCTFTSNTADNDGGGMFNYYSNPDVDDCTFTSNTADNNGGGMYNYESDPDIANCGFNSNRGNYAGGGMYNDAASPTLDTCTFTGNDTYEESGQGGGMYNNSSSPLLTDCDFLSNEADNDGGGMYNYESDPTMGGCTFASNHAYCDGGGMYNNASSPTIVICSFETNSARCGAGMYNDTSSGVSVSGSDFTSNIATQTGGGMYNLDSSPTVTGCTFESNTAYWSGGGMYNGNSENHECAPTVIECVFLSNQSQYGGGMYNYHQDEFGSTPLVESCYFLNNQATYCGGGIYNNNHGSPKVVNCVFAYNQATDVTEGCGGGIYNCNESSLATITNCTFYNNSAAVTGDAIMNDWNTTPTIANCILWDGGTDEIYNDNGAAPTVSYCDVQGGYTGTGNIDADPLFFDAAGGDFHIFAASPCLDAGDNTLVPVGIDTDFDEEPRVMDGDGDGTATVDMGADECLAQVWVSNDYCDGCDNDGHTWDVDAFDNIQNAIDAVVDGGTVNIHPGGYIEKSITIVDKSLTIKSISGDWHDTAVDPAPIDPVFTLEGEGSGPFDGDVTFSNISIIQGNSGINIPYGLTADSTIAISGCCIYNNGTGIAAGVDLYGDIFVDGCIIGNNTATKTGIGLNYVYGTVEITDSVIGAYWDTSTEIPGNAGAGIQIDAIAPDGNVLIDNNIIAGNTGNGIADGINGCTGQLTIINNVIGAYDFDPDSADGDVEGNGEEGIYLDYIGPTGVVTIEANTITDNVCGITVDSVADGTLLIHGNTIENNLKITSGIHINSAFENASVNISLNNMLNNNYGVYYYYNAAGYLEYVDASYNWWGATDGPGGEGPGTGDDVSTNVTYDPWLEVSVEGALAGVIITDGTLDNTAGADTEVVVTGSATVTSASFSDDPSDTGFSGNIGKYIDVHIDDASGVTEIQIRLYYTDDEIDGLDESSLVLYWWDGTDWTACSDSGVETADVDSYSGYIWANITATTTPSLADLTGTVFGGYGEEPQPPPATTGGGDRTAPRISNINDCGLDVTETTADICWTTNEPATSKVEYWADDDILSFSDPTHVNTHHVQLTDLTPCTTYSYRTISRDNSGNTATSDVYTFTTLGGADIASSDLSVSPAEVSAGEEVTISVVVTNSGGCAGSYTVTLQIDGVAEATEDISLDGGESQTVSFTTSKGEAGSYSVAIDDLSGSFTVTAADTASPTDDEADEAETLTDEESSTNWPLIGGIIAGVIVLLLIAFFALRRGRG